MGGNILYLCGMVDKRTMEKYEREAKEAGRESWYLSWALDSTLQEIKGQDGRDRSSVL
jgi:peptide chain release factor subunit 3